ncbi:MAG: hypothetical protein JOZ41_11955 [Chloroflexi bacterium]|nr:hypothetical protein [Chloroflexota bacterium]
MQNAAICAAGLRALAQHLAAHHDTFNEIATCTRAAIWLERQLAKRDDNDFLADPDTGDEVLLPMPPEIRKLAESVRRVGQDLSPLHDYGQLGEVCCLFAVAAGAGPATDPPLLELAEAAMDREDFQYAAECFEQLQTAEDTSIRLNALYNGARAHAALADRSLSDKVGHWRVTINNLRVLEDASPPDLEDAISPLARSQLTTLRHAIEERMRVEQHRGGPSAGEPLTGLA